MIRSLLLLVALSAITLAESNFTTFVYFDREFSDELLHFETFFTFPTTYENVHNHTSVWTSETNRFTQLRFEFSHVSFFKLYFIFNLIKIN